MEQTFYSYVSTKCSIDCIQTIFICAPEHRARNISELEVFIKTSGWEEAVEKNGAVLIAPVISQEWKDCSINVLTDIYDNQKNSIQSKSGLSIPGRNGYLWMWETMIYGVGYDQGAEYVSNVLVNHPNFFAGSVLINGAINDFSNSIRPSSHWLVSNPSDDYTIRNNQIPISTWLFNKVENTNETLDYFCKVNHTDKMSSKTLGDINIDTYYNSNEFAHQIRCSFSNTGLEKEVPGIVMKDYFNKLIRWKNSPDGTLKIYSGKEDFFTSDRFKHFPFICHDHQYPYSIYLPKGLSAKDIASLPLVISLHGRGEPRWAFAEKNGWDTLADETQEFILLIPDSDLNIWEIERDYDVIDAMLKDVYKTYHYDKERVYITGFSNGAIFTSQQASTHPHLFAAASAWNGPSMSFCQKYDVASYVYHPDFVSSGYEMPFYLIVGDNDTKAGLDRDDELDILMKINHCSKTSEKVSREFYSLEKGYVEGNRFDTQTYSNQDNQVRLVYTVMKNMPHGAIWDESRAAWEFMKRFKRIQNGKRIIEI